MQEQFQALENLENVTSGDQESDIAMMPPPSFFDSTSQPPFVPSTPGVSSIWTSAVGTSAISKGKHKDTGDHDNSARTLVHPPGSSKSLSQSPSALGQLPSGGRSVKSAHVSMPEAVQQMGTDIQELTKGLTTSFDCATNVLEACTTHNITHSMDPIPLCKQKAILQVQEEGLEDHEVVAIIEHFQSDVTIADPYLMIKKDSIHKLFLMKYSK
jgi:hypothetical protein